MTPLFELPASNIAGDPQQVSKAPSAIAGEVAKNWGRGHAFFDLRASDAPNALATAPHIVTEFFSAAAARKLRLVPVTGPSRSRRYQDAVASVAAADRRGSAFRLSRKDLAQPDLPSTLDDLLNSLRVPTSSTDLIVDLEFVEGEGIDLAQVCSRVPLITEWRTFTVIGGAFPKDLTEFTVGCHLHPRSAWRSWRDQHSDMLRVPTFGDYGTLHPLLATYIPGMNTSASIRYTGDEDWVIMRGAGLRNENGTGYDQYPANALLLRTRPEYCGPAFSAGDGYINDIAQRRKNTGNPTTWLQAGMNHHLTFVTTQIANLFAT